MRPLLLSRKKLIGLGVILLIVVLAFAWVQYKIAGILQLM